MTPQDPLRTALEEVMDVGIYPAATPSGPRTPWQDGWNAGVMAVSDAVEAALALPRQDEPNWLKVHAEGPGHHYSLDDCRAALRAAPAEPQPAVPDDVDLAGLLHDNDFPWDWANAVNAVLEHHGLVVKRAATEPADGTLDEAWKAAEAAISRDRPGVTGGYVEMLNITARDDDERWAAAGMTDLGGWIAFGPTPALALLALAARLRVARDTE